MMRFLCPFTLGASLAVAKNTLLDDQLCQVYYTGTGDCGVLRAEIHPFVRGNGVPTLELGSLEKPAMMFLHGWPDTAAIWANQFEKFCLGDDAPFFCVAPSWIDFHPDFPRAEESLLFWDVQRDLFHSVVEDLGLKNITLVIFDFGAKLGYQYIWQHAEFVKQVIAMDIGMDTKPPKRPLPFEMSKLFLMQYQQNNIEAFKKDDDDLMAKNLATQLGGTSPCNGCRIAPGASGVGACTGWPYYQLVRSRKGEVWIDRLAPDVPLQEWRFSDIPSFPDQIPMLFLYSSEIFSSESYRDWLNGRGDRSMTVKMEHTDHWLQVRVSAKTNAEMQSWLFPDVMA